jgi:hypothetical protein
MKKIFALFFLVCGVFQSCEKKIEFELEDSADRLVIEATIENNSVPIVVLTKSTGYFSKIDPQLLSSSFVHGSEVRISDGSKTELLKEYSYPLGQTGYVFYFYSVDTTRAPATFLGKFNTKYSLQVVSEGKEYKAETTIPSITKRIDTISSRIPRDQEDSMDAIVMVKATDPPGFGDYVRYFTKRNREGFLPPFSSVFDDLVIDGTTYELQVEPGIDRNRESSDDGNFFKKGDTVTLKLCNIDKASYDFWRTMEYSYGSVGNPFATPVKVISNISNGALGYFGGYGCQYHTIIIPR